MTLIDVESSQRIYVRRLSIVPELAGAEHRFRFGGRDVCLTLSKRLTEEKHRVYFQGLGCSSWRKGPSGELVPSQYEVGTFDITVRLPSQLDIPQSALEIAPRRDELFRPAQVTELDRIAADEDRLIEKALIYWYSIIRWKSGYAHIGAPTRVVPQRWSTYLQNAKDKHHFWMPPEVLMGYRAHAVTVEQWHAAQAALTDESQSPVGIDFIFEAMQRHDSGDILGTAISAAVGLEASVRTALRHSLPVGKSNEVVIELLDNVNFRAVLNRRKRMPWWDPEVEKQFDFGAFNEVMNCRDKIMHEGETDIATGIDWKKVLRSLLAFSYFLNGEQLPS